MTFIKRMKRGKYVYLAECKSVRDGKKVRTVVINYLGREGEEKGVPLETKKQTFDWKPPERSSRYGDVAVLWEIANELKMSQTIDRICFGKSEIEGISAGKLLTIWAINRVIDPQSATQLDQWLQTTVLPDIVGISDYTIRKDDFYASLDAVCHYERNLGKICENIARIDEMLYIQWRTLHPLPLGKEELIAYDLTAVPVFGDTCPLAERGYNATNSKEKQIKLGVLISKFDKQPISHQVYPGNFNDIITMEGLVPRLDDFAIQGGTLIWDRGNTSKNTVQSFEKYEWDLICGVPKKSKEVVEIVRDTEILPNLENHVPCGKKGHIYAIKKTATFFGKERNAVIYLNLDKSTRCLTERNYRLSEISEKLTSIQEKCKGMTHKSVEKEIKRTLTKYHRFVEIHWLEPDSPCFNWNINQNEKILAEKTDGKYLLYATNSEISAKDVVMMYLNKDYVEKFFRDVKSENEITPVRHQLESRVCASMFVGVLAYRLKAALKFKIESTDSRDITLSSSNFLKQLNRVEKLEMSVNGSKDFFFVNLTKEVKDQVIALNMKNLFPSRDL